MPLNWTTADVLSAEVPLDGGQTLLTSVEVPGVGHTTLPPTCLPYSPEFALRQEGEGRQALQRMARATGGIERLNLGGIWSDLPRMPRMVSLTPWLLMAAMVLLLVEVLQRRTGLLSLRPHRAIIGRIAKQPPPVAPVVARAPASVPPVVGPATPVTAVAPPQPAEPAPAEEAVVDPFSQARNRAARRTQR